MLGIQDIALFIGAGLMLNMTPGADMLYVIARSSAQGFSAGVSAALGIGTGGFVHIAFAVLGLSALLATSATAFTLVKYAGAAYLIYLGINLMLSGQKRPASKPVFPASDSLLKVYWQGILINTLNPKVALFFLAFLPQFIEASSPHKALAFLLLGSLFNITGTLWNTTVAWSTVSLSRKLKTRCRQGNWLKQCAGALFVGLGVKLAVSDF